MCKVNDAWAGVDPVKVLGIPLWTASLDQAVSEAVNVCRSCEPKLSRLVSATGAHGLVTARRNPAFARVLKSFHHNLPDGMPAVWVGRLKGAHSMRRCYGPDFFRELITSSGGDPIRHYLCGGKQGVAEELRGVCEAKFGNRHVVGAFCPPFREMSDTELATLGMDVEARGTDVLWIGLSTPKQEVFALRLSRLTRVHYIVTVGAAFDFHVGRIRQAPRALQRAGLEWLFRLCMEPRRLHKRYAQIVPLFLFYNLVDLVRCLTSRNQAGGLGDA